MDSTREDPGGIESTNADATTGLTRVGSRGPAAILVAATGFTLLFAYLTEASIGHNFAYRLGACTVYVGACSVAAWFLVRLRSVLWNVLLAPLAVGLVSFALIFLTHGRLDPVRMPDAERMQIDPPQRLAGLQKVTDSTTLQQIQHIVAQASVPDSRLTAAAYGPRAGGSGSVELVLIGFNITRGTDFEKATVQDQQRAVAEFAAGAHLEGLQRFESGASGSTLACGVLTVSGGQGRLCFWIAPGRIGEVLFVKPTTPDAAAKLTRDIRTASEVHAP